MTLYVYIEVCKRWDSEELVSEAKVLPDSANESGQIKIKHNITLHIYHTSPTLQIRPLKKLMSTKCMRYIIIADINEAVIAVVAMEVDADYWRWLTWTTQPVEFCFVSVAQHPTHTQAVKFFLSALSHLVSLFKCSGYVEPKPTPVLIHAFTASSEGVIKVSGTQSLMMVPCQQQLNKTFNVWPNIFNIAC